MDDIVLVAAGGGPPTLRQEVDAAARRAASTRLLYAADWQRFQLGAPPAVSGRSPPLRGRSHCSAPVRPRPGAHRLPSQGGWPPSAGRASSPDTNRRNAPTAAGPSPRSWPVSGGHAPRRWRKRPRPTRTC